MKQLKKLVEEIADNLIYVFHIRNPIYGIHIDNQYIEIIFNIDNHDIYIIIPDIDYIKYYDSYDIASYIMELLNTLTYKHTIRLN